MGIVNNRGAFHTTGSGTNIAACICTTAQIPAEVRRRD